MLNDDATRAYTLQVKLVIESEREHESNEAEIRLLMLACNRWNRRVHGNYIHVWSLFLLRRTLSDAREPARFIISARTMIDHEHTTRAAPQHVNGDWRHPE